MQVYASRSIELGFPGIRISFSSVLPFGAHVTRKPGKLPESLLGASSAAV